MTNQEKKIEIVARGDEALKEEREEHQRLKDKEQELRANLNEQVAKEQGERNKTAQELLNEVVDTPLFFSNASEVV